ncbi:acyltransferase family protein [Rhizorhabdus dicambivorans]|uniref:acyltransferase family protein n=1 Tax=Rhizorhabdus dicambivorans TaxID=1850238 RepID=UPI00082DAD28|nr:acyltransferase family protein [Rhizorhabdus dicambivorans]
MQYRNEIDGLRAVAVLPVILFHAGFSMFSGGYVGVDVFFVISGYLITNILIADLEAGRFSLWRFYERRARRILPALFLVTLCCIPFAWLWMLPSQLVDFSQSLVAVNTFTSNILFWRESGYFDAATELKPLLHTWSLAVEEQFYIFFPPLLAVLWRYGRNATLGILIAVAAISLALAQWGSTAAPSATFYLIHTRIWELGTGSACALLLKGRAPYRSDLLAGSGIALILCAVFLFDEATPFPSAWALAPVWGTALIILFGDRATATARLLSRGAFVQIGLISYSAYLWHQPLFAFARIHSLQTPGKWMMALLALASLILAYLSWRFVERPFRRPDGVFKSRRALFGTSAAIAASMCAAGIIGHASLGFPNRLSSEARAVLATNMDSFERGVAPCWDLAGRHDAGRPCMIGDVRRRPSFALVGDSHAGALLTTLNAAAAHRHIAGRGYTFRSCPPLQELVSATAEDGLRACENLRRRFFNDISHDPQMPGTIIVNARWTLLMKRRGFDNGEGGVESVKEWIWKLDLADQTYEQRMAQAFARSILAMVRSGKTVILIYPVPEMGWNVPQQLAREISRSGKIGPASASISHQAFLERSATAIRALDAIGEYPNLIRIRPSSLLCHRVEGRCVAHMDGRPLYLDSNHLSDAGAALILGQIMGNLTRRDHPHRSTNHHQP